MVKRFISVVLSLLVMVGMFVGCSNNQQANSSNSNLYGEDKAVGGTTLSNEEESGENYIAESTDEISTDPFSTKDDTKNNNTKGHNKTTVKDGSYSTTTVLNSKYTSTTNRQTITTNTPKDIEIKVDNTLYKNYPELTESYMYPNSDSIKFKKNNTNIYENQYVKVDARTASQGYLLISYKDPWADKLCVALDETASHSGVFQKIHIYNYNKGDFNNGTPIALALPKTDAIYYLSVLSEIKGNLTSKISINLGQITVDGYASYQDMVPGPEQIKVSQVSSGVYSNKYVKINTNTSNKGYVEIEYIEPNGYDIIVSVTSNVKNQYGNLSSWSWATDKKGKCKINLALTYGNAEYTISVTSSMDNKSTGVSRVSKKAELTVNITNVPNTAPFLLNGGEVQFDSDDKFIKKASEISATCKNNFEKVSKIYDWLTSYLNYRITEDTVLGEYKCNLDKVYDRKTGVCYDYAVVLAAMLRSQGIPCKVVFGKYAKYNTNAGHAWNEVYIAESGSITSNKLSITGGKWCRLDPTFSNANTGENSIQYINNSSNYIWREYY